MRDRGDFVSVTGLLPGPAEYRVIRCFALDSGAGSTPLFGSGSPPELVAQCGGTLLSDEGLLDAAAAAQDRGQGPVVVLGGVGTAIRTLLDQPQIRQATLLLIGTGEPQARAELEAIPWFEWPRVRYLDLEYCPPRVLEDGPGWQRLEGGLGLVILDADAVTWVSPRPRFVPVARLLPGLRSALSAARMSADEIEAARLDRIRLERAHDVISGLTSSTSWRITSPLRAAKRAARRARQ